MTLISNQNAKKIVSYMGKLGFIPVGSYGRNSHIMAYNDLDFLFIGNVIPLRKLDIKKFIANGKNYVSYLDSNGFEINIWRVDKKDFYKTYLSRILPKYKVIYLNKLLKI
jgi:hypothetical protein